MKILKNSNFANLLYTNVENHNQLTTVMIQSNTPKNKPKYINDLSSSMTKKNNGAILTIDNHNNASGKNNLSKLSFEIDKIKLIDLIYYTNKLENKTNTDKDDQQALLLAKSLNL